MHLSDKSYYDKAGETMKKGDKIRNKHTKKEYMIIDVDEVPDFKDIITVFVAADDNMNEIRFNTGFMHHYEVILG